MNHVFSGVVLMDGFLLPMIISSDMLSAEKELYMESYTTLINKPSSCLVINVCNIRTSMHAGAQIKWKAYIATTTMTH